MHFAIKASGNRLIKLEMLMKDVRSNSDDDEKENQQRHGHTTTNHLSIQKNQQKTRNWLSNLKWKNWDKDEIETTKRAFTSAMTTLIG